MNQLARGIFLIVFSVLAVATVFADGSKDLYPGGVKGNRAFLVSRDPGKNAFSNNATHFVYTRSGETLAIASSAVGIGLGLVRVTKASGETFVPDHETKGQIKASLGTTERPVMTNREAELAGPRVGYDAIEIIVDPSEAGIWKIEFIPPRVQSDDKAAPGPANIKADENWSQDVNSFLIAAWDISVRDIDDSQWVEGRVYTNVLNLHLNNSNMANPDAAFYGRNYVLTKDGYFYKVNGNGSHGIDFQYFVNNSGVLKNDGTPSYTSSNEGYSAKFHSPNEPDNQYNITHKMFYTFPDRDLPYESTGAVPSGKTWLLNQRVIADIKDIHMEFIEGASDKISAKGAFINFHTNQNGRYKVNIISKSQSHPFAERNIIIDANIGVNKVWWDRKDGEGNFIPLGDKYGVIVSVNLIEGEIHFPYFDMEINPNGIQILRLNSDKSFNSYAQVYWDDSAITEGAAGEMSYPVTNLTGLSSEFYGHKWGTYSRTVGNSNFNDGLGAASYGNNKAMDTWTYTTQVQDIIEQDVTFLMSDLAVESVKVDQDTIELGETVTYKVVFKNYGPSDAEGARYTFDLPEGFIIHKAFFDTTATLPPVQFQNHQLHGYLNFILNEEITLVIIATTRTSVPDSTYGYVPGTAGIVRPAGVYDPDATSIDLDKNYPGNAQDECSLQGCNNLKANRDVFLLEPFDQRGQMGLVKMVKHNDTNGNGFHEAGETLSYTFRITNTGKVNISKIYVVDSLLKIPRIDANNLILSPGETTELTVSYSITASDVLKARVTNSASVFGVNPRGFLVKDVSGTESGNDDPTEIDIDQPPVLAVRIKTVNKGTGERGQFTIGDHIEYQVDVRHTGKILVGNLQLTNSKLIAIIEPSKGISLNNSSASFTYYYVVTKEDIDRGFVELSAKVIGFDSKNNREIFDISGITYDDDKPIVTKTAVPPLGIDDEFVVYQGNIGVLRVLNNDKKGSSELTMDKLEIVAEPLKGTVAVSNGAIYYTPLNNSEFGSDKLTYKFVDNSRLESNEVSVLIEIKKTNPVAENDIVFVGYNYMAKISPAKNDHVEYSSIDRASILILEPPINGNLIDDANGVYIYTPNENFTGYDKFTYTVKDLNGNWSDPAVVSLEVKGLFIPNAITPNGDQFNDNFFIVGMYVFDRVELEVVDRFGRIIYHSSNYSNDWAVDPKVKEGTYFYTFKGTKNGLKPFVRKGSLLIIRELKR